MNVISNAIDAIEGSGEITITTAKSDHMFILSVADTGSGIPAAVRDRIFEPFFTTKPIGQGTGLGLAISWGFVKKHNGDIDVRSEEGKGTEFIIRIPMQREGERHGDGQ
jgi:two-component system NtrC family sensor kinase